MELAAPGKSARSRAANQRAGASDLGLGNAVLLADWPASWLLPRHAQIHARIPVTQNIVPFELSLTKHIILEIQIDT